MEIDLEPLLRALWKKLWLIVLMAVVFGVAAYAGTKILVTPTYRTSFTAYVNNRVNVTDEVTAVSGSDMSTSQKVANAYAELLKSQSVLTEVADTLQLNYSYGQLASMVSTSVSSDTQILTVYVTMTDPTMAAEFATGLANLAPELLAEIVEGSSMKIIDMPNVPGSVYQPNYTKNAQLGALLGAVLVAALVVLKELLDDHIKDESELESRFNVPLVGVIPDLAGNRDTKKNK